MIHFMRDGGFPMWLTLAATLLTLGLATANRAGAGRWQALGGSLFVLLNGVLGYASGMVNVVGAAGRATDTAEKVDFLVVGTREALNNLLFSVPLALLLAVAAALLARSRRVA